MQNSQGTNARHEGTANRRDPNSLQCFRWQGLGHMAWECPTPATALNHSRGDQVNVAKPPASTSPKDGTAESCPSPFPQSRPHSLPGGCSNEAPVIMDRQGMTTLIDSGAQVSSIVLRFVRTLPCRSDPWVGCWN